MAVAVDLSGNVLVGDSSNYRVRRISTDGRITTLAGNGLSPGAKDNGPATSTPIGSPTGLLTMPNGDVYVSDNNSNRIWLTHEGMVSPVAGIGNSSPAGDGDLALTAAFYRPSALALDSSGNLLIADNLMHRVRKLLPDGTVQAFAGTGQSSVSGDGHAAASAGLPSPTGIAIGADGAVYIPSLYQIRKIDSSGTISLLAGSYYGYADSTTPAKVMFAGLGGIALDSAGNLYVADTGNQRIRKISPTGAVITVAGTGATGMPVDGVPATESPLNSPSDVAIDAGGNLYIADRNSYCVRKVTPGGTITTFAGTPKVYGNSGDGGPAASARFGTVESVKLAPDGSVWVSDSSFNVVRRIDPAGIITTVAGSGSPGFAVDGPAWAAQLLTPTGLAVTTNGVYIADSGSARVLLLTRPGGI
jgi:sugar lactone lactonase YvrE